ncbi:SDR family oxidoreductase [Cellulomonas sp. Sa3CUA2]|uniref:SDR family oxidoreductase n=1 Tax=Cellulomonas avistercoris TaxID=2762242 RepID=A0ABR8QFZ4_9CELL|nr:SDR family oxidoreductase [Cellulomonas avistercoris]MBD7919352.1 SDR family oxidoreductase [Cellulomonas avistercoris]
MTEPPIGVTGATGHIGGLVARHLDDAGRPQRLLVRSPGSPRLREPASVTGVRRVDYAEHDLSVVALRGVSVLLMVSAHESATRAADHATFIDAAADAGVKHVVYTSFAAAAPDATFTLARDHYATEEHLKASGMAWTFLRDTFYLDLMDELVGPDGVIRGPAGDGRCAFVARGDVARVAAAVLLTPDAHAGATYDVTGPQGLSLTDVARVISDVDGRDVTFHDETLEEAYASRASYEAPTWQVAAWVSTYTAIASGVMAEPSDAVERLTGLPPTDLETVLRAR